MSDLSRTAAGFRAALLANDSRIAGELVTAFAGVLRRLQSQVDALTQQIEQARLAGEPVNLNWLYRQERYLSLIRQTETEISAFAQYADARITAGQQDAVGAARRDAPALIEAALGGRAGISYSFNTLPREAFLDLVGSLRDGSPLSTLLSELSPTAAAGVEKALLDALALGLNPNVIADAIRKALGGSAVRALTIARTEILRAYRTSSLRTYQANSAVVDGWIWDADSTACDKCRAEDGGFHSLDEQMDSHPRCRCAEIPHTKSWADLGFADTTGEGDAA